jgi:hypothetical protein
MKFIFVSDLILIIDTHSTDEETKTFIYKLNIKREIQSCTKIGYLDNLRRFSIASNC